MFFFSSQKPLSTYLPGFADLHCHLLPGVDDGVRTPEESLELLKLMEAAGMTEVWFTPHIMEDMPNTTASLREKFETFKALYHGSLTLYLAAEYMLDTLFEERLERDDLLPHRDGTLLVETSFFNPPFGLDKLLDRIRSAGYTPLLAHPERYRYMEKADYRRLKEKPIKFQLNLPSLAGMYGPTTRKCAESLLKAGLYDYAGSDTHSLPRFKELLQCKVSKFTL